MRLLDVIRQRPTSDDELRGFGLDWYQQMLSFEGTQYPFMSSTLGGSEEKIEHSYFGYVEQAYKANGPVFAVEALRTRVFSEARFAWQRREQGRPQQPFTDARLTILERPWPGGTTQDLLQRMLLSADLGGNAFVTRNRHGHLRLLRPDWVSIVRGSDANPEDDPEGIDATLVGYIYKPGGPMGKSEPVELLPEQVAHFAPDPDPLAQFRGMSWLTPVLREISGDSAMSEHKNKFLANAATPNLVVRLDASVTPEQFQAFKAKSEEEHRGFRNAYKTMYVGGGADVTVAGSDLKQLDFKAVQGHGETRIAMAGGVHPVVVGMSEGMQGSSLNSGNYNAARRNVADTTFHPLWRNAAGSLATIIPHGVENLIADTRDVPFLRQDEKDAAEIRSTDARTINQLITAGFTPESAVAAISGDFNQLAANHTGLVSVQLQPPGENGDEDGRSVNVEWSKAVDLLERGWTPVASTNGAHHE